MTKSTQVTTQLVGLSGDYTQRGRSRMAGNIILDNQLNVTEVDEAMASLWPGKPFVHGLAFKEVVAHKSVNLFKGRAVLEEKSLKELLLKVLKSGTPQQFTLEFSRKDDSKWFLVEVMRVVSEQHGPGVQLMMVDVSKMMNYEVLLQRQLSEISDQNRQWQAMYSSMLESIILLDTEGKIISMNPATETITGVKASEGIGRHIGEIFPKVDATVPGLDSMGRSGLEQTMQEQRPSDLYEAVVATRDGKHIWVNYTYTPLKDAKGNINTLVRVTSDVSTVKAVEQMKNDFVSIASHELRTPLGVINSYLNLFLHGHLGELTESQKMYIQRVFDASDDMSALVEDLLNMSRIESGRLELASQSFYVEDILKDILSYLEQKKESKQISITIDNRMGDIQLFADRQKLDQALTNIIDNAIKYTYNGGNIIITIKRDNEYVEISVQDSGVGIKPENLGHIFEKFYREGNPLSVKEGGSGLGLYISRKLVELHGGSISVSTKHGEGSTFTVKLPIALSERK